jgi:hypothetical protein
MADLICGQANDTRLALSKCPAPGISMRRTSSPARVAVVTYVSTSDKGTNCSRDPNTST